MLQELTDLPDIDSQPSLVVLDSPDQIPMEDPQLLNLLKKVNVHIVIISKNCAPPDLLQTSIDCQLIRGMKTIEVHPLSMIHATQRLVQFFYKRCNLIPTDKERSQFSEYANIADGSPEWVDALCPLLLEKMSAKTEADIHGPPVQHVADVNNNTITYEQIFNDLLTKLSPTERELLSVLSIIGRNPIAISINLVNENMKSIDPTKDLSENLKAMKLLLPYPAPIVYHPKKSGASDMCEQRFYVPEFLRDYVHMATTIRLN